MKKSKNIGAFPTCFRGALLAARNTTYANAGYMLASIMRTELFSDGKEDVLDRALSRPDAAEAVWKVIAEHLPRCYHAVPARRRRTFRQGIEAAIEEGRV